MQPVMVFKRKYLMEKYSFKKGRVLKSTFVLAVSVDAKTYKLQEGVVTYFLKKCWAWS